jgi:hypothetical protein
MAWLRKRGRISLGKEGSFEVKCDFEGNVSWCRHTLKSRDRCRYPAMSEDLEWTMQESIVDDFRELTYRPPIGCGCRF